MADENKYFPANFATRQREEVDKLNALVDTIGSADAAEASEDAAADSATAADASATAAGVSAAAAAATLASVAPKDSPTFTTLMNVPKHATAGAPAYAEGRVYYDTTTHKLTVGGASGYETVTSVGI